jgi:hypothetical protein
MKTNHQRQKVAKTPGRSRQMQDCGVQFIGDLVKGTVSWVAMRQEDPHTPGQEEGVYLLS